MAVAGAVSGAVGLLLTAQAARAATDSIELDDCSEQVGIVTLPAALVANRLPAGLRLGKGPLPPALAYLTVSGEDCAANAAGSRSHDALAMLEVEPPAAWRDPAISAYFLLLDAVTDRPETAATLAGWGYGDAFRLGAVSVALDRRPLLGGDRGEIRIATVEWSLVLRTGSFTPELVNPGAQARAFVQRDGVVIGALDARYSDQTGRLAIGSVFQRGPGPLPLAPMPATGSQSHGYTLRLSPVRLP